MLKGVDHHTLRVAQGELEDDDRVQTAAVFCRRDRVDGDGVDAPVEGVLDADAGEGGRQSTGTVPQREGTKPALQNRLLSSEYLSSQKGYSRTQQI